MTAASQIRALAGGANQQGVRAHNERLILSLIQRHGALPGSALAKQAGLSPQTVSVILRQLEAEGFVEKGDPQRGQVGKPRVPIRLRPEGIYSVGLNIGRRRAGLVLMDLGGTILDSRMISYAYPMPDQVLRFLETGLAEIEAGLGADASRIAGIGVASPYLIWQWAETIGAPKEALLSWQGIDLAAEIGRFTALPIVGENDATAACQAEHVYGRGKAFSDYVYAYIGSFIGGGIVLNNSVYRGPTGNAGALGPLPVTRQDGSEGQLLDVASLFHLETTLRAAGLDPDTLWSRPDDWSSLEPHVTHWIDATAPHLARMALAVTSVIDFEAVLIDGAFPAAVRETLVAKVRAEMDRLDTRGLIAPRIEPGSVGPLARETGAATAPIISRYLLDTHRNFAQVQAEGAGA